ncbi:MAG: hypothetical protein H6955_18765 [Chromatiaceae bacterium]|nr:hypothetical protein [Chromatiaceae bacterium]
MSWSPPASPSRSVGARIAYWQAILELPPEEPGAAQLHAMATERLMELEEIVSTLAERRIPRLGGEPPSD